MQISRPVFNRHYLLPLSIVALILGVAFFGERGILYMFQMTAQKNHLSQKIAEIQMQNHTLRQEISALRNDRDYIERVARTELGMVKDDELVFQFSE
jgi:cell division protein FtsB